MSLIPFNLSESTLLVNSRKPLLRNGPGNSYTTQKQLGLIQKVLSGLESKRRNYYGKINSGEADSGAVSLSGL